MDGAQELPFAELLNILTEVSMPLVLGLVNVATGGNTETAAVSQPLMSAPPSGVSASAPTEGGMGVNNLMGVVSVVAGSAYALRGVLPKALAVLTYGSEEDADPNVRAGRKHIEQGQYTEAVECFDRAIAGNPDHRHAYNNRAVAYFYLGMFESCITDCDSQIEAYPESTLEALSNKAMALEELERFEDAIETWSDAAEAAARQGKPAAKRANIYNKRGQLRVTLGDNDDAVQDFNKGLSLCETAEGLAGRADAELRAGCKMGSTGLSKILHDVERAVQMKPDNADYFCILGRVHASIGGDEHLAAACSSFSTAIELDDELCDAYLNRAFIHRSCDRVDASLRDLAKASALDPSNVMVHINRADIISANAADMPAHLRAIQEVNKAIEKDSQHWLAYSTRGTIYHRLKRKKEAIDDFNRALGMLVEQGGAETEEYDAVLTNLETIMSS